MESPSHSRGRGRFSARKRHTFPARSSSQHLSDASENPSAGTPAMAQPSSSLSFETPSPSNARGTRMRTRNLDGALASPDELSSKGGRSLRKRTRIDYSFDQADEEDASIEAKSTPTSTRSLKRRKTELTLHDEDHDEEVESRVKRRTSEQPPRPTSRRNAVRKPTVEPQPFVAEEREEDVPVQDTIEVGGHHSEQAASESSSRQRARSSSSRKEATSPAQPVLQDSSQPSAQAIPLSISVTGGDDQPEREIKLEAKKEQYSPNIEIQEQPPAEQPPLEQPPLEQPLPDQSPPEQSPPEQPPPEESPPEQSPPEQSPPEQSPPEQSPPEQSPPEQSPPQQPSAEPQQPETEHHDAKPEEVTAATDPVTVANVNDPYAHLTPYVDGDIVYYPSIQTEPEAETEAAEVAPETEDVIDDQHEPADDDTPVGSPGANEDTAVNSPAPELDLQDMHPLIIKNQYPFKKATAADKFIKLFQDMHSLTPDELYTRVEIANKALAAWQAEFDELRKITDDEDNALRYQQEEATFLQREKMAVSRDPNANPMRKDFVIRGIRAPKPDAHIAYMRQQDKVMASIYGFEHDDRDTKVGQQDPIGQRRGLGKGRLRDRPKQTAKAAEADDGTVILGKRARKPTNLFAEAEPVSRGSTPVPVPQRRQRGRRTEENGDDHFPAPASQPELAMEETPKKRGRGGRPRKHPLPAPIPEYAPVHEAEHEYADEGQSSRKRSRRHREEQKPGAKLIGRPSPASQAESRHRRHSNMADNFHSSFYSNHTMGSGQANDESRPATASSTQTTASTTVSAYGLREKRQRRFIDGEDDDDEDFEIEDQPKPKRVRRATKKVQEQEYADVPETHAPAEPEAAPAVKVPRIKIKNFTPGTTTSAPTLGSNNSHSLASATSPAHALAANGNAGNGAPPGAPVDANKEYGQMTKSEKMSYSMRARWANGSMGIAVEKRRATLYAKKMALEAARKADQRTKPPGPGDNGTEQQ